MRIRMALFFLLISQSWAQYTQQGSKLVGTGAVGGAQQGVAVALSADGNTALVGGLRDNNNIGAAWVFTRSAGAWTQQRTKLVGSGVAGSAGFQGIQVALSADGDTAIVGGTGDNKNIGASWVFVRSNGVWSQQGPKLTSPRAIGQAFQGFRVALSADGNTALIGASGDNNSTGAAWVYTRANGVWSEEAKLVGLGATGAAAQGWSVALSADGNTALVGGAFDRNKGGAAWVFTRAGRVWSQQGNKLVGTGASGLAQQGWSVALSADGNTALVEGAADNNWVGAGWIFTRTNGAWTQQGGKLVGSGAVSTLPTVSRGHEVALSADGNLAVIGAASDANGAGAIWVFQRSNDIWAQLGGKLAGAGAVGAAWQGYALGLSADGSTLIEGGPSDNNNTGAAWVFTTDPIISLAGVTNSASYGNPGTVAPGEILAIFGSGVGPTEPAGAVLDAEGKVATLIGETRVLFDGSAAPMILASASQTNVIVPYAAAAKQNVNVAIEFQGRSSNAITLPVIASAPGLFTIDASGTGQAAALNQDSTVNGAANPAEVGSIVVLFGTGEGQTDPAGQDGLLATETLPKPLLVVQVTIGGRDAEVLYRGAAPGFVAGVLQINAKIPLDVTPGPNVPVEVKIGNQTSRSGVTLAVR
jgi:uncharacterized protein (TIGR03437 family)